MKFTGANNISLDGKNRLAIPTRYREILMRDYDGQLMVTAHHADPCLVLYPMPEWHEVVEKLTSLPTYLEATRNLTRLVIGFAAECPLDSTGRILLPETLREYAGLTKRCTLTGQGSKFELWDEDAWKAGVTRWNMKSNSNEIPEELKKLTF